MLRDITSHSLIGKFLFYFEKKFKILNRNETLIFNHTHIPQ